MNVLTRADRAAAERLRGWQKTPTVKVLGAVSDVADQYQLLSVCTLTALAGAVFRRPRVAATGGLMALGMLTATALKNQVKDRVDRTRPFVVADGGIYTFQRGNHDVPELDSFPSGHTAGIVAVALTVARRNPALRGPAMAVATSVALIQMPRQKHYPTDLIAGALIGVGADTLLSVGAAIVSRLAVGAALERSG